MKFSVPRTGLAAQIFLYNYKASSDFNPVKLYLMTPSADLRNGVMAGNTRIITDSSSTELSQFGKSVATSSTSRDGSAPIPYFTTIGGISVAEQGEYLLGWGGNTGGDTFEMAIMVALYDPATYQYLSSSPELKSGQQVSVMNMPGTSSVTVTPMDDFAKYKYALDGLDITLTTKVPNLITNKGDVTANLNRWTQQTVSDNTSFYQTSMAREYGTNSQTLKYRHGLDYTGTGSVGRSVSAASVGNATAFPNSGFTWGTSDMVFWEFTVSMQAYEYPAVAGTSQGQGAKVLPNAVGPNNILLQYNTEMPNQLLGREVILMARMSVYDAWDSIIATDATHPYTGGLQEVSAKVSYTIQLATLKGTSNGASGVSQTWGAGNSLSGVVSNRRIDYSSASCSLSSSTPATGVWMMSNGCASPYLSASPLYDFTPITDDEQVIVVFLKLAASNAGKFQSTQIGTVKRQTVPIVGECTTYMDCMPKDASDTPAKDRVDLSDIGDANRFTHCVAVPVRVSAPWSTASANPVGLLQTRCVECLSDGECEPGQYCHTDWGYAGGALVPYNDNSNKNFGVCKTKDPEGIILGQPCVDRSVQSSSALYNGGMPYAQGGPDWAADSYGYCGERIWSSNPLTPSATPVAVGLWSGVCVNDVCMECKVGNYVQGDTAEPGQACVNGKRVSARDVDGSVATFTSNTVAGVTLGSTMFIIALLFAVLVHAAAEFKRHRASMGAPAPTCCEYTMCCGLCSSRGAAASVSPAPREPKREPLLGDYGTLQGT